MGGSSMLGYMAAQQPPAPQQQGVLPPTSPVQPQGGMGQPPAPPQPGTQQDPMMQQLMQGTQQGQQAYGEQLQRMRGLADTVGQLQSQQQQMAMPKMGPGIDHGASTLHNIGQILLMAANMTGPGRAVNQAIYSPGKQQYATQQGALAQRIQQTQAQEQIEEQPLSAAAGLQYHPFQAAGAMMRGSAAETTAAANTMNAQTRQIAEQHKNAVQIEGNRIKEQLGQGKLTEEQARTQMMGLIGREHDAAMRDVANIGGDKAQQVEQMRATEEDFKTESDHWLQNLFGGQPSKPVTPAGGTPSKSAKPGKGGATHVWTPQGLQPVSGK
jgi:hypothetical protein